MARNIGLIKLEGRVDDLSFYKGKTTGGKKANLVREKGGVSADRIKNDPNFARTRENMSEFAKAGQYAKGVKAGADGLIQNASDSQATSRLTQGARLNINLDLVNVRGERVIQWDQSQGLAGVEFNIKTKVGQTFLKTLAVSGAGTPTPRVTIPSFIPMYDIRNQSEATHFKMQARVATVDANGEWLYSDVEETDYIETTSTAAVPAADWDFADTLTGVEGAVLIFAITMYQEINGVKYPLKNKSYNAAKVLAAFAGV